LSLVYALLDRSPVIRVEHLMAAVAVLDYVAASVVYIFGDALGDSVADRILAALREGEELTRNEIHSDLFSRHVTQARIESALQLLAERGLACGENQVTGGRPTEVWRLGSGPREKRVKREKPPDTDLNALNAHPAEGE
jgi:hypothetical protein